MEIIWILAISLFLIIIFLFWKLTNRYYKKEYGEKMWKRGETRGNETCLLASCSLHKYWNYSSSNVPYKMDKYFSAIRV